MGDALSLSEIGMMLRFILLLLAASRAAHRADCCSSCGEVMARKPDLMPALIAAEAAAGELADDDASVAGLGDLATLWVSLVPLNPADDTFDVTIERDEEDEEHEREEAEDVVEAL